MGGEKVNKPAIYIEHTDGCLVRQQIDLSGIDYDGVSVERVASDEVLIRLGLVEIVLPAAVTPRLAAALLAQHQEPPAALGVHDAEGLEERVTDLVTDPEGVGELIGWHFDAQLCEYAEMDAILARICATAYGASEGADAARLQAAKDLLELLERAALRKLECER